jgi:hypothetical protein
VSLGGQYLTVPEADDSDPRNWQLSISDDHVALYSALKDEPRGLSLREAQMLVELVDAWRAHEHRKHIALMNAIEPREP